MLEAYEDVANEELEKMCEELKRKNEGLQDWLDEMQNENRMLKAQLDIVYLIFGKE